MNLKQVGQKIEISEKQKGLTYAKSIGLSSYASYFSMVFAAIIVASRPFTGKLFDRLSPNVLVYPGSPCSCWGPNSTPR
ncbi:hypothetical protein [Paenibacillus sp. OAS669]|uniref:hypothetical protein n=1 Tax=Paenibacillus sp. OAS669 TaxID=2663821 RepID=UPI0039A1E63D